MCSYKRNLENYFQNITNMYASAYEYTLTKLIRF